MKLVQATPGLRAAFSLAAALCLAAPLSAQTTFTDPANLRGERVSPKDGRELPIDQGATGLAQLLRKLNTRASLMNIVAHPDDEDGGMLTLYSRGLGARVADLSLNRGEGGQNAMTADFEDALGLLRTQELLASDRYSGVDQFFGTQVDFGFSKTKSESFAKWGHDRVLYDVVRAIRLYRPLVITSTWIGGVTDGHGQHQVSGQIAQEAFVAAGDPKVFPELTAEGILPWQPLKIYARVPMQAITPQGLFDYATGQYVPAEFHNYVTGETTTAPPSVDIVVHEGTKDPLLTYAGANPADLSATGAPDTPLSYVQFSRIGLGLQKSQIGPGVRNAPTGTFDVSYHLYGDLTCNAPATLKPPTAASVAPPQNCHPERPTTELSSRPESALFADAAERPASPPADASPLVASNLNSQPSFFDGIDTSLASLATLAPQLSDVDRNTLTRLITEIGYATAKFEQDSTPSSVAPYLGNALQTATELIHALEGASLPEDQQEKLLHELRIKHVQLNNALALALGLTLDATTTGADQTAGATVSSWFMLKQETTSSLLLLDEHYENFRGVTRGPKALDEDKSTLTIDHPIRRNFKAETSLSHTVTRPYFTRNNIETPVYTLTEPTLRNAPATPPALIARATVDYRGVNVEIAHVVHDGLQPLQLVPAASVSLPLHARVLVNPPAQFSLNVTLLPLDSYFSKTAKLELKAPEKWAVWQEGRMANPPNAQTTNLFNIRPPQTLAGPSVLTAEFIHSTGISIKEGFRAIGYGDLPRTNLYAPATIRIVPADLKLPERHNIAYLPGTGDSVPEALASIGLAPAILTVADLVPERLKQYDTVILGVRTYNAHPDLHGGPTQALIEYARNGGNVLVQFQTYEFTADDAPYPLSLGSAEKVVDETAPVTLLTSTKPRGVEASFSSPSGPAKDGASAPGSSPYNILTTPNLLTPADFNGWNEERGHGFLSTWDDHYTPLLEVHDPGEPSEHILPQKPQRGGLLTVQLGKGRWTYCAYALYRQLPEAVPGAFRLFANLIIP